MTEPKDDLMYLFEKLAAENRHQQGEEHPTIQRLAAYQAGQLSPVEADAVQEHLAVCRECTDSLLNLSEFQELMEAKSIETTVRPEELPIPGQTQASWRSFQARLPANPLEAPPASRQVLPGVGRFRRLSTSPTVVVALAASLLACLIGFPLWIAEYGGPSTGKPWVVYPPGDGEVTRGVDSGRIMTLQLAEGPALVALPLPARASFPAYRIEIRTSGGELRLSANAVPIPAALQPKGQPPPSGDRPPRLLAIALARGQLAAGNYRLRLLGVRGLHDEVIAEHALRVPAS